jgi:hypothetical protein
VLELEGVVVVAAIVVVVVVSASSGIVEPFVVPVSFPGPFGSAESVDGGVVSRLNPYCCPILSTFVSNSDGARIWRDTTMTARVTTVTPT